MKPSRLCTLGVLTAFLLGGGLFVAGTGEARAEILAMMNYESKTPESLKALKLSGEQPREEGIAVVDVDPESPAFGQVLMTIPLPPDLVAHHIFYDRRMEKAYVTSLGKGELHVMNMQSFPYRLKKIEVPQCQMGEDVIFTEDNRTWYLTCMNSANVVVGDVATDRILKTIEIPGTYPHGLAVHSGIDRVLVTDTVSGDLKTAHESITVIEASSGRILGKKKLSLKDSPSGEAPVEILFVPGANPPVAYVTNMFGGTLWTATWNPETEDFDVAQAFDFNPMGMGVPLEMYFNSAVDRLYVTTAKPGHLHVFDISAHPAKPELLKTLPAAEGAHHVAITLDEKYAFVQNALLNLPGMSDGSVTVIDLEREEVVAEMTTLKDQGFNPNSIVLLPTWNHLAGH